MTDGAIHKVDEDVVTREIGNLDDVIYPLTITATFENGRIVRAPTLNIFIHLYNMSLYYSTSSDKQ